MNVYIPWQRFADFQFDIALDGTVYILRLRWNHIGAAWVMDILTRNERPLILGNKLVRGALIASEPVGPPGFFLVLGMRPPTFSSFSDGESRLLYVSRSNLAPV